LLNEIAIIQIKSLVENSSIKKLEEGKIRLNYRDRK